MKTPLFYLCVACDMVFEGVLRGVVVFQLLLSTHR